MKRGQFGFRGSTRSLADRKDRDVRREARGTGPGRKVPSARVPASLADFAPKDLDQLVHQVVHERLIRALDHDAGDRLGAGIPHDDPTLAAELLLGAPHGRARAGFDSIAGFARTRVFFRRCG